MLAQLFSILCVVSAQDKVEISIPEIVKLLNEKNSSGLLHLMADSCTIGNLPKGNNEQILQAILKNFSHIKQYKINSDSSLVNGGRIIQLIVVYGDDKKGSPSFSFNRDGQVVNLGVIKARMTADPTETLDRAMSQAIKPDTLRVPFCLENGLIYVAATLNDQEGVFMLDSGCPVVILKKDYVAEQHINKQISVDFVGMGGAMQGVQWSVKNRLLWSTIHIPSLDAPVVDMPDRDLGDGTPVFGLLGYGVFADYQITFDYSKQVLLLERVDSLGNVAGASFSKRNPFAISKLEMKRHIPIVPLTINGNSYPMGIDCGANANVLKQEVLEELKDFFDYEDEEVAINGVGNVNENNKTGYLMHAAIGNLKLRDMYTVLTNQVIGAGTDKDQLPIVGLLGTPFLNQYRMCLNFKKKELVLLR